MATWIIGAIVAVIIFFAVRSIWKNHKNGGCSGCSSCGGSCHCHNRATPPTKTSK